MKYWLFVICSGSFILLATNVWACPAGKTCPAGADCVANESLCVADSSSSSSSSSGTSTEPTTVKEQVGLTLDPEMSFTVQSGGAPVSLSAGSTCTINCAFAPLPTGAKTGSLTVSGAPSVATSTFTVTNTGGPASGTLSPGASSTIGVRFQPLDAQNATIPVPTK